ncbi:MAG: hypothetical protein JNL68_15590 [Burkholderiales bacterium]|nr:hypothetical protein [Burkholderiales bacterium]
MRDQWYADTRDLVKWGVLFTLAEDFGIGRILQVAYARPSKFPQLQIDGKDRPLPTSVLKHMRSMGNITTISKRPCVEVLADEFKDRASYLTKVVSAVQETDKGRTIVFLDPDTGLQPTKPGWEHVLDAELTAIWAAMPKGHVLVFYQHRTNYNGTPWLEPKRAQFEAALGLEPGASRVAHAFKIAQDVAFFFAEREVP